jgi:hypothetical protein
VRYVDAHARDLPVPPEAAWQELTHIGGDGRWWTPYLLWQLRGLADRAVGGRGLRLGRAPAPLAPGDTVDFWQVESVAFPALRMRALARLPGTAYLAVTVEPRDEGSRMVLRTEFDADGVVGHAYWWSNLAAHRLVFSRIADRWATLLAEPVSG